MKFPTAFALGFFAITGAAMAQEAPALAGADPVLSPQVSVRPTPRPANRAVRTARVARPAAARVVQQRRPRVTLVAEREQEVRPARRVLRQPGPTFIGAFF